MEEITIATKKVNRELLKSPIDLTNVGLISQEEIELEIKKVIEKIDLNIEYFGEKFPWCATKNNIYPIIEHSEWTEGFWTGMLWLAYEYTNDVKYRELAEKHVDSFSKRLENNIVLDHHDLGFLYSLSCVSAYKLTGNQFAKNVAIKAADKLLTRWQEKGEFIQAWGEYNNPQHYRFIIDCLLNIPLLYWAYEETGEIKYSDVATRHFNTSMKHVIREDASAYHTFFMDPETGEPVRGVTHQGYSDSSSWARGQAWAIYGIPLNMRYTNSFDSVELLTSVTNYFINRLPKDMVPYWDLIFDDSSGESKDSSSAAIAICGIDELLKLVPDHSLAKEYKSVMHAMMRSLMTNYTHEEHNPGNPILYHGVYSYHSGKGVDEGNIWGDYYYMEALMRLYKKWEPYW